MDFPLSGKARAGAAEPSVPAGGVGRTDTFIYSEQGKDATVFRGSVPGGGGSNCEKHGKDAPAASGQGHLLLTVIPRLAKKEQVITHAHFSQEVIFQLTGDPMKRVVKNILPLVAALVLLCGGWTQASVSMPDFSLPSAVDGKMVSSKDYKGKVLLVTFFATWCPPCMQEVPTLMELHKELGPKGFAVLALSVDEGGPGIVAKLVERRKINYPVLMADRSTADEFGGIAGIPTSFLVNRKGHVVKRYPGYVAHKILMRDIEALL